jgi:hypothetical protein
VDDILRKEDYYWASDLDLDRAFSEPRTIYGKDHFEYIMTAVELELAEGKFLVSTRKDTLGGRTPKSDQETTYAFLADVAFRSSCAGERRAVFIFLEMPISRV